MSAPNNNNKVTLPFGVQSLQEGSMKTISKGKLATFAVGQQKKSRFQKAREEKEKKAKEEEAEAAAVYESFVASFEDGDADGKTFIRGGQVQERDQSSSRDTHQGSRGRGDGVGSMSVYGGSSGEVYKLQGVQKKDPAPPAGTGAGGTKKLSNMALMLEEMKERDSERAIRREGGGSRDKPSSQVDNFLDNVTHGRLHPSFPTAEGELGPCGMGASGSFHTGDPHTTNLYVGNLSPTVTEELLCEIFGRFGPVNSAKVMWPRSEEERLRKKNCGFVSFVHRADAEDALAELNDSSLEGKRLSVGWGKAVKILATPRYVRSTAPVAVPVVTVAAAAPPVPAVPPPRPAQSSSVLCAAELPPHGSSGSGSGGENMVQLKKEGDGGMHEGDRRVQVHAPACPDQRRLIDCLARYVAVDGEALEMAVRTREQHNPAFAFLQPAPTSNSSTTGADDKDQQAIEELRVYYRWRTLAYLMEGEGVDLEQEGSGGVWRVEPFQLTVGGSYWVPPPLPVVVHSSRDSRRSRSRSRSRSASPTRRRDGQESGRSRGRDRDRSRSRSRSGDRHSRRYSNRDRHNERDSRSRDKDKPGVERERDASEVSSKWKKGGGGKRMQVEEQRSEAMREQDRRARFTGMTGAQIERARAKEQGARKARLSQRKFEHFSALLDDLELTRESIREAMGFALDNCEAAEDIVKLLGRALLESVSPPLRVARLYLCSDILHNSGAAVKHASQFRSHLQAMLPGVMAGLGRWRREDEGLRGRMSGGQLDGRVLSVLRAWSNWAIFPPPFLVGLEAVFFCSEADVTHLAEEYDRWVGQHGQGHGKGEEGEESVKRRARFAGLALTVPSSAGVNEEEVSVPVGMLLQQLGFVEEFSRSRSRLHVLDSTSLEEHAGSGGDEEGESIFSLMAGVASSSRAVQQISAGDLDDIDGDDIDGVPLSFQQQQQQQQQPPPLDDYDDVDGVPLDGYDMDGSSCKRQRK